MNWRIVRTILAKELLDTLRDRRTLIMMIGVPILLYPMLTLIGFQVALMQHQSLEQTDSRVALLQDEAGPMRSWLETIPKLALIDEAYPMQALAERRADAVVVVRGNLAAALEAKRPIQVDVYYDVTEPSSRDALQRVISGLEKVHDTIQTRRLSEANLPKDFIHPFRLEEKNAASPTKTAGSLIGSMLPLFMLLTLALGAFYPAVDLTAGEKERGTFETLLATPASKLEIVTGKFGAVFTLAMSTCLLNLASMVLTFVFIFSQMSTDLQTRMGVKLELPLMQLPIIIGVMVPMAFFVSAVMMSLAVLARNFKEAQNFVTPFLLVITLPAFISAFPGVRLGGIYQFVPITNVSLLFKEMMVGQATLESAFFVFLSTCIFAVLALLGAAWLFQREEVILAEDRGLNVSLRRLRRVRRKALTPAGAMVFFSVLMLLMFYAGAVLQQWRFVPGLLITEWVLILGATLFCVVFFRLDFRTALHLRCAAGLQWIAAGLIAAAWIFVSLELVYWMNRLLPMPEAFAESFETLFTHALDQHGLTAVLVVIALSPAICEELAFRGLILSAVKRRMGGLGAVIVVGLLFGAFHLSIYRLAPTAVTGFLLTYLALRTGSVWPCIAVHALYNGCLIVLSTGTGPLPWAGFDPATVEKEGLPPALVLGALAVLTIGVALLEWSRRRADRQRREAQ